MEFLGVGPLELLFIFLIALVVLGPKDMAKTGRTLGRFMYRVVTSPTWQTFRQASRDLRQLPTKLMREAGLEEQELQKLSQEMGLKDVNLPVSRQDLSLSSWTTPTADVGSPATISNSSVVLEDDEPIIEVETETENSIAPPRPIQVFDHLETLEAAETIQAPSKSPVTEEIISTAPAETDSGVPSEIDNNQETETQ